MDLEMVVMNGTFSLSLHLPSCCSLFLASLVQDESWAPRVLTGSVVLLAIGSALSCGSALGQGRLENPDNPVSKLLAMAYSLALSCVSTAIAVSASVVLSPLLGSLTATISLDTVAVCVALLLTLHLYLADYSGATTWPDKLSGDLALALAMCASVLIASTLEVRRSVLAQVSRCI
jgi:hypothetical protein